MSKRTLVKSDAGRRLRWARRKTDLSARELCDLAGVTSTVASMIERGHIHRPSADVMARFAPVLGVSLDWLLRGTEPEPTREQIRAAVEAARARSAAKKAQVAA